MTEQDGEKGIERWTLGGEQRELGRLSRGKRDDQGEKEREKGGGEGVGQSQKA